MSRKKQLFLIPYAGGTGEVFDDFIRYLDKSISTVKIEYSGHGSRRKEAYYDTFQEMTEDVAGQINAQLEKDADIAIFGYSMGSIVAYELVAQGLLNVKPSCVLLASHEAPDVEWESKSYYRMDDMIFFQKIQDMGGFERCTPEMLRNRFFKKLHFEPVREDYRLLGNYKMSKESVIDVPAILFYSKEDIPKKHIRKWEPFLGEKSKVIEYGGGHFFIREYAEKMAEELIKIWKDIIA